MCFTDSRVDRVGRIALDRRGLPDGAAPTFVALTGEWPGFDGTNIAANGIRPLPDGSLVLDHSSAGGLWQVDPTHRRDPGDRGARWPAAGEW